MRIGQFIESVGVKAGGTSTAFLNMLAALRTGAGLSVHAYAHTPDAGDPAWMDIESHRGAWTVVSGYGRALSPGPLGRAVIADIESGRIDLLHLHGLWSPDLLGAAQACRRAGVPFVWEPHGMLARDAFAQKRWKKEIFLAMGLRRVLRSASRLVFVTAEERDTSVVPSGIGPRRFAVVPLPVQMPASRINGDFRLAARRRFGVPEAAPCVVFMGRFHPVKRIEMAMRAVAEASKSLPQTRLLLIGGGDDAYTHTLRALAAQLGLADRVIFGGWVQGEDKWVALSAGDVLTLNSLHENFGFVAVEALCVGTAPVLTGNLAIAGELAAAGVARVSDPNDAALAEALKNALMAADPDRTGASGRAWVAEHLSVNAVGRMLADLYTQCAAEQSGRGTVRGQEAGALR